MTPRVLILEPHDDVRLLLELSMRAPRLRAGRAGGRKPGPGRRRRARACWGNGRTILRRLGDDIPPVVCLSIFPREAGFAPPESVAYLIKPASLDALGDALRDACGACAC